jgi:hypothetical protein
MSENHFIRIGALLSHIQIGESCICVTAAHFDSI